MNAVNNLPASVLRLTVRQTVELFKVCGGGTVGFDFAKKRLDELRYILNVWAQQHAQYAPDRLDAVACQILAAVPQAIPAPPTLPAAPQVPAPPHLQSLAAAVAATVAPPAVPGVFDAALDALAVAHPLPPVASASPFAGDAPDVATIAAPAPVQMAPLSFPCWVPAAQVWPEFSAEIAAHCPDLLCQLWGNPEAPTVDATYIFQFGHILQTLAALACTPTMRVWLGGPRGTGKTKFAEQVAARTGRPLYRVNFNRATEASEIIGDTGLRNGSTDFVYGPVAAAVSTPGALLMLDELTYGNPGNISSLNAVLERLGAHLRLPRTDKTLTPAEGFACFVGDNTFGFGDPTGEHAGRQPMGVDTRDRVNVALTFSYLPKADETRLLQAIVLRDTGRKLPRAVASAIVDVMSVCRAKSANGELAGAPSLRGASAFATLLMYGVPVADAYTSTVVLNAPPESHEELRQTLASHWPADLANQAQKGA